MLQAIEIVQVTVSRSRKVPASAIERDWQERKDRIKSEIKSFGDIDAKAKEETEASPSEGRRNYTTKHYLCYSCQAELTLRWNDKHYGQPVLFCGHKCLVNYLKLIKWEDIPRIEGGTPLQSKEVRHADNNVERAVGR